MANPKNPSYRLTGINPLAYMGVEPLTPPGLIIQQRQPTINDSNFNIGQLWVIRDPNEIWMLVQLNDGEPATWVQLYPGGGGGTIVFETDLGQANPAGGILNVFGTSPITTTGSGNTVTVVLENGSNGQVIIGGGVGPAWANITAGAGITIVNGPNSITISSTDGEGIDSIDTNSGSAAPVAGTIQLLGDNLINTSAVGNVVTVALDLSLDGQLPIGSTSGPTVMANITSGDGSITVTNGSNSIDLTVTGAMASEYVADTGSAVPAAGILEVLGANIVGTFGSGNTLTVGLVDGLDGQIPIAATGTTTEYAYLTSGDGSITFTFGPNTIDMVAAGGGGGGFTTKLTKFTSSGTWTKSANCKTITCILWSGGCGGGSGALNSVDSIAGAAMGGAGGSGASVVYYSAPADFFSATQSVIVGAGGSGGASISTPTTQGIPGSVGGFSSIGSIITGPGLTPSMSGGYGSGGLGGYLANTATSPSQQMGQLTISTYGAIRPGVSAAQTAIGVAQGGVGAKGSSSVGPATTPNATFQSTPFLASGGGGGGSGTANNAQSSGALGGNIYQFDTTTVVVAGGSAGSTSGSPTGGNGNVPVNTNGLVTGGSGGGGGAGERTSAGNVAGAGGNGAAPGGGGGGGGGGRFSPSGAGGNGGRGEVWVYEDISGSSANRGAFLAYYNSDGPRTLQGDTINYLGADLAMTTSFDIDNAFYEGNGSGSEAVYTAPVTGIYYFSLDVCVVRTATSNTLFYPIGIIVGPDFNVAGQVDRVSLPTNASGQMGTVNTYLSLNAGDEVKFAVSVGTFNNYGLRGPEPVDNLLTQAFTTKVSGGLIG